MARRFDFLSRPLLTWSNPVIEITYSAMCCLTDDDLAPGREYRFRIFGTVSEFFPAITCAPPDMCFPAEGGEVEICECELISIDGDKCERNAEIEDAWMRFLDSNPIARDNVDGMLFREIRFRAPDYDRDYGD